MTLKLPDNILFMSFFMTQSTQMAARKHILGMWSFVSNEYGPVGARMAKKNGRRSNGQDLPFYS